MTLSDFLADADALTGEPVKVVGWLASNGYRLWLADRATPGQRLVVVAAPEVTRWLRANLCPRIGGMVNYLAEAEVRGVAGPRNWEGLPVIGGGVRVALTHGGQVVSLQDGPDAVPGTFPQPARDSSASHG